MLPLLPPLVPPDELDPDELEPDEPDESEPDEPDEPEPVLLVLALDELSVEDALGLLPDLLSLDFDSGFVEA
ncbi:MAG TPA: hypothetical protein VLT45_12140 [Kofleriaceae bacterium]|nr:hypothetical protein [Kofleriaceae bacterium]